MIYNVNRWDRTCTDSTKTKQKKREARPRLVVVSSTYRNGLEAFWQTVYDVEARLGTSVLLTFDNCTFGTVLCEVSPPRISSSLKKYFGKQKTNRCYRHVRSASMTAGFLNFNYFLYKIHIQEFSIHVIIGLTKLTRPAFIILRQKEKVWRFFRTVKTGLNI